MLFSTDPNHTGLIILPEWIRDRTASEISFLQLVDWKNDWLTINANTVKTLKFLQDFRTNWFQDQDIMKRFYSLIRKDLTPEQN